MRIRVLWAAFAAATSPILIAASAAIAQVPHTVQPGESLWSIASVNGIAVEELAAANGLSANAALLAGTTVQIPPATPAPSAPETSGTGACTWHCQSPVHPHPTDETVSSQEVGEVAAEQGMSPSLVQAIAWQESGFNNAALSSAGARGVMQIIPDTWRFIEQQLAGGPLPAASARSNVEAGVMYLHHLYHLEEGDREGTIGSYFQGPNRDGFLPETVQYLDSVLQHQANFAASGG